MQKDAIGIIREIDKNGRIVIPIEYRNLFKLEGEVEVLATKNGVFIRSPKYKVVEIEDSAN